jgi:hypothetical protein
MNRGGRIIPDIRRLIGLFVQRCDDRSTLDELAAMAASTDRGLWLKAHGVFDRVRLKSLAASKEGDDIRVAQYLFEEACAKTFYNLAGAPAPFDPDSPYWIVPSALVLASRLKLDEGEVLRIVAA